MTNVIPSYIPPAAALGGVAVGCLAAVADIFGAAGCGSGLVTIVVVVFNYCEIIMRESGGLMNLLEQQQQ